MKHILLAAIFVASMGCQSHPKKQTETTTPAQSQAVTQSPVKPESKDTKGSQAEVVCSSGNDSRKLALHSKDAGCELYYEKFSQREVVATARSGEAYCQEVMTRISSRLESAGFTCK